MHQRSSGAARSLVGVLLPFMMSAYSAFSISMIVAQLAHAFSIAVPEVLLAIPLDFIGGALGGVVMGYLADRYGRRPLLVASSAIFGASILAAAAAGNIWEIYAAWFVAGFGVNSQNGISYPVVVETLRRSTGTIGGTMQSLYFIGFLLDSLTYMYFHWWRVYLVVVGAASLILSVPSAAMVRETVRRSAKRAGIRSLGGRLALYTVAFSAVVAGAFMLSVPLMGVVPTLLYGMGMGAIYVSAFSLVGFASFVLAGYLSDRLGRAVATSIFAALGVVSSVALALAGASAYFLVTLAVVYVSSGFFSFTGVWASESYPMELRATATNVVFLVGRLLGGFSPMLVIALYPSSLRVGLGMSGAMSAALALAGVAIYVLAGRMRREVPP